VIGLRWGGVKPRESRSGSPELVTIIKPKIMKTRTLNFDKTRNMFTEFALSTKEMINVRGGSGEHDELLPEPIVKPCNPPIKI